MRLQWIWRNSVCRKYINPSNLHPYSNIIYSKYSVYSRWKFNKIVFIEFNTNYGNTPKYFDRIYCLGNPLEFLKNTVWILNSVKKKTGVYRNSRGLLVRIQAYSIMRMFASNQRSIRCFIYSCIYIIILSMCDVIFLFQFGSGQQDYGSIEFNLYDLLIALDFDWARVIRPA